MNHPYYPPVTGQIPIIAEQPIPSSLNAYYQI